MIDMWQEENNGEIHTSADRKLIQASFLVLSSHMMMMIMMMMQCDITH